MGEEEEVFLFRWIERKGEVLIREGIGFCFCFVVLGILLGFCEVLVFLFVK